MNKNNEDRPSRKKARFVENDKPTIFSFVRDGYINNASIQIPASLLDRFSCYPRSIGQISCGNIQATCWLVRDKLVITNYHVYRLCFTEREKLQNSNLSITVTFDYEHMWKPEHIVTIEVDEERDPMIENPTGTWLLSLAILRKRECIWKLALLSAVTGCLKNYGKDRIAYFIRTEPATIFWLVLRNTKIVWPTTQVYSLVPVVRQFFI